MKCHFPQFNLLHIKCSAVTCQPMSCGGSIWLCTTFITTAAVLVIGPMSSSHSLMILAYLSCHISSYWHYKKRWDRVFSTPTYAAAAFMFHAWRGNDLLWKLMASVIFQKVTLHLAQRLFSTDLYLFKGGLRLSAITNALTNNWAVCHLEFI